MNSEERSRSPWNLLRDLTIKKFHEGLLDKKFSALEVTQASFKRIKEDDKKIGAYLSLAEESALRQAEAVDLAVAKDEEIGPISPASRLR